MKLLARGKYEQVQDRKHQRPNCQARKYPPQGEISAYVLCVCARVCMYARERVCVWESVSASVPVRMWMHVCVWVGVGVYVCVVCMCVCVVCVCVCTRSLSHTHPSTFRKCWLDKLTYLGDHPLARARLHTFAGGCCHLDERRATVAQWEGDETRGWVGRAEYEFRTAVSRWALAPWTAPRQSV